MNKLWHIPAATFQARMPLTERHRLTQLMHLSRYEANKVVYSSSLPGDVIYLIQSGGVILYQTTPDKTRRQVAVLGPGDLFGSLSLIEQGTRDGQAMTIEPTSMLVLRKSSFEQLMKYFSATGAHLVAFLQAELDVFSRDRKLRNARHAYARLCRLLLHFLDQPSYTVAEKPVRMQADARELASLLGTRPDVVNHCLDQLESRGIIERHHHELRLKDPVGLQKEAG